MRYIDRNGDGEELGETICFLSWTVFAPVSYSCLIALCTCFLLGFAVFLGWTIAASVWVYGASPSHHDADEESYCDHTTYAMALALVTLSNIALSLLCPAAIVTGCFLKREAAAAAAAGSSSFMPRSETAAATMNCLEAAVNA